MNNSRQPDRPIRRRPRDRRTTILTAATDAFSRDGYHGTSMADIASAVGISPAALYRHFRNKQLLLGECLLSGLDATVARLDAAATADLSGETVLRELVTMALELRGLPRLWQLEFRNLTTEHRQAVLMRAARLTGYLRRAVRVKRPDLAPADIEIMSWCVLSVAVSPSYHHLDLASEEFSAILGSAIERMLTAELAPGTAGPLRPSAILPVPQGGDFERAVRAQRLVAAGARLFNTRGYAAVGIEDIGAAVGVRGPALYHHFASKADLLNEIIERNEQWIGLYTDRALSEGRTAHESARLLLGYFVEFALAQPDLVGTTVSEVGHLPETHAARYRRTHRDGVLAWARLLAAADPALTPVQARVLVQALSIVVIDAVRNPRLRRREKLADVLTALCARLILNDTNDPMVIG
ncbi:helix-turn-helix domain-containing protein [Nocardia sp. No.11]|uniref:TetR/AcrR family transcriptional regulator n=1 Tax=Nocardia sp. No.11 TaxID=3128861 RepID=UPI00319DD1A2